MRGAVIKENPDKIIAEGVAFEELVNHRSWELFKLKLEEKAASIQKGNDGVITDLNKINYDNGRRRGLKDALSVAEQAITRKKALENKDAEGG